jgi:hypothetical protein
MPIRQPRVAKEWTSENQNGTASSCRNAEHEPLRPALLSAWCASGLQSGSVSVPLASAAVDLLTNSLMVEALICEALRRDLLVRGGPSR